MSSDIYFAANAQRKVRAQGTWGMARNTASLDKGCERAGSRCSEGNFLERLSGGSLGVRKTLHNNTEGSCWGPEGTHS